MIKLNRNSRAQIMDFVAVRLVHRKAEVLQHLKA